MSELVKEADARRAAQETRLSAQECRCLRMGVAFGRPLNPRDPTLEGALGKLRAIEGGGGQ